MLSYWAEQGVTARTAHRRAISMLYYAYACGFIFAMTRDFVLDLACTLDVNRWSMIDTALAGLESSLQGLGATCLLRHASICICLCGISIYAISNINMEYIYI